MLFLSELLFIRHFTDSFEARNNDFGKFFHYVYIRGYERVGKISASLCQKGPQKCTLEGYKERRATFCHFFYYSKITDTAYVQQSDPQSCFNEKMHFFSYYTAYIDFKY